MKWEDLYVYATGAIGAALCIASIVYLLVSA